ncbi:MAG: S1C family serine protease [Mobilitalea sp.]
MNNEFSNNQQPNVSNTDNNLNENSQQNLDNNLNQVSQQNLDNNLNQVSQQNLGYNLNQVSQQNLDNNYNQVSQQNIDNNLNKSNQQNLDNNYTSGGSYTYGTTGHASEQTNNNPYMVYPTPQFIEEGKPKKKSKIFGLFKFTAAAVTFGLIAGIVFQGYYNATVSKETKISEEVANENKLKLAEVTKEIEEANTIIATGNTADTVITDVSEVVANVMPSIVAINSSGTATGFDFFGREYNEPMQGSGSGIIIDQNGSEILIVTNNHVIEGTTAIEIVFADETTATAVVKGAEANADLAVLSVNLDELSKETAATIKVATIGDSSAVKAGEMAIAIGNALGYGQSVTVGYISAVGREVTIEEQTMTLLQTDAAINPGNSGGALINTYGQVIGINSVKFASEAVEGMGYAIPISDALPMINELMNREVVNESEKGFLGIDASTAQNVTDVYAERFNMPIGIYINDIIENSPAESAGLMQGDIITGVGETKVETIDDLVEILSFKKVGDVIDLKVQVKENGAYAEKTLVVTLGKYE